MNKIKSKAKSKSKPKPKPEYNFSLWNVWVATTLLKILLFPAYHSTDFDVHRNWLSIAKLLPLKEWYIEKTSQWTLDYPPFFAFFEWTLAQLVPKIVAEDGCIELTPKGEYGFLTIAFQRCTVILSEIVLFIALQWFINTSANLQEKKRNFVIACSIVLSPGLMIVDHIHFQYNGMLFGILVFSIVCAKLKKYLLCGFSFAVLICFKHIFLYVAPCYFVFLLSGYCLNQRPFTLSLLTSNPFKFVNWINLVKLGSVVLSIFAIAFGPFAYYGVLPQLFARLFPFSRGLTHAYWAPNIWAIYSFIDRVLIQLTLQVPGFHKLIEIIFQKTFQIDEVIQNSKALTKGLVGEVEFVILPDILPSYTFILTLFYQVMSLIPLFIQPTYERFLGSLSLCAWASFLFGWHVHEKAILLVIIPLSFIVAQDRKLLPCYQALTTSGYVSLFPLLYGSKEWLFKVLFTFVWCVVFHNSFNEVCQFSKTILYSKRMQVYILDRLNLLYVFAFVPVVLTISLIQLESGYFEILKKFQFLQLMIYSVYCAIGVISSWNWFTWLYFLDDTIWEPRD
ncbi:unnamed protein product [Ambrosiozyma monospora]|uniref:Unnamed protein product n=1 Tax=Ambrosiozyma monospora TaxID=43982 RepID=A0ACB5TDU3_AMBMO|nr:unnamed protein product [Ambrosiozyma monospora]